MTQRLDNFTDAAFAFAVSLLVIGGAGAPANFDQLARALGDIPAFAFGFAVVVMFWTSHVRWRHLRGEGDWRSTLLTLLLVFLTLIYIQPLRGMAAATGMWFTGRGGGFGGSVANLFAVYGTGFVAMSAVMFAMFRDCLRNPALDAEQTAGARGEATIWAILAATGLASILMSFTRYGMWAAMIYATLPLTIGLFASRFDWTGTSSAESETGAEQPA